MSSVRILNNFSVSYFKVVLCAFSYAKALHYKEEEFHNNHDVNIRANIFDSLILVNNKLQQKEAAEALLVMAQLYETDATQVSFSIAPKF